MWDKKKYDRSTKTEDPNAEYELNYNYSVYGPS